MKKEEFDYLQKLIYEDFKYKRNYIASWREAQEYIFDKAFRTYSKQMSG